MAFSSWLSWENVHSTELLDARRSGHLPLFGIVAVMRRVDTANNAADGWP